MYPSSRRDRRDRSRRMARTLQAVRCGSSAVRRRVAGGSDFHESVFALGTLRFQSLRGSASVEKFVAARRHSGHVSRWCPRINNTGCTYGIVGSTHLLLVLSKPPFDPSYVLRISAFWPWPPSLFRFRIRVIIRLVSSDSDLFGVAIGTTQRNAGVLGSERRVVATEVTVYRCWDQWWYCNALDPMHTNWCRRLYVQVIPINTASIREHDKEK